MIGIRSPWLWGALPLSAILAISGLAWNWISLPDPAQADRAGLIKWLVLKELSEEGRGTQLALLDQMQVEFGSGPNLDAAQSGLSETLQARLDRNLRFLQQFWFFTRVEQLGGISAGARVVFLDDQIAFAERWGELTPSDSDQPDVFDMIDDWIASSQGKQKELAQNAVRAALQRFLQTRPLDAYPAATRLELANRIVEDLELGMSLGGVTVSANDAEANTLRNNGMLLVEAWLTDESRRYLTMSLERRIAYLDLRIEQIREWGVLDIFAGGGGSTVSAMTAFAAKSSEWIKRADDEDREGLQMLFRDVTQRLLFGG